MKRTEFLDKVASDTREYVESLMEENHRLGRIVAELEVDREQYRRRLEDVESERRRYAERYAEVEQQNTNLANLYVASYQLHGTLDRERVVETVKEIIINLIGSEELGIWEVEEELDALSLIGSFGIDAAYFAGIPIGSGTIGKVAETGERYIADSPDDADLLAVVPLKLDEKVIGVIGIFRLLQQKPGLEAVDYELFDLLGSHAASALFCTRLAQ